LDEVLGARAHSRFAPVPGAFSNTQVAGEGGEPHFLFMSLKPTHLPVATSRYPGPPLQPHPLHGVPSMAQAACATEAKVGDNAKNPKNIPNQCLKNKNFHKIANLRPIQSLFYSYSHVDIFYTSHSHPLLLGFFLISQNDVFA
jgi:hypothetical protein